MSPCELFAYLLFHAENYSSFQKSQARVVCDFQFIYLNLPITFIYIYPKISPLFTRGGVRHIFLYARVILLILLYCFSHFVRFWSEPWGDASDFSNCKYFPPLRFLFCVCGKRCNMAGRSPSRTVQLGVDLTLHCLMNLTALEVLQLLLYSFRDIYGCCLFCCIMS